MTTTIEGVPSTIDPNGAVRFALHGDVGLDRVYNLSAALVRDLLDGHRSFVLDLTDAGAIDPRLWPKLVDWTLKLEQIRRPGERPSRFSLEGVNATHRAAIHEAGIDRLYSVHGIGGTKP
jgi:hypothetical protein